MVWEQLKLASDLLRALLLSIFYFILFPPFIFSVHPLNLGLRQQWIVDNLAVCQGSLLTDVKLAGPIYVGYYGINTFALRKDIYDMSPLDNELHNKNFYWAKKNWSESNESPFQIHFYHYNDLLTLFCQKGHP